MVNTDHITDSIIVSLGVLIGLMLALRGHPSFGAVAMVAIGVTGLLLFGGFHEHQ